MVTAAAVMLVAREQHGLAKVEDVGNAYVAAVRSGDRAALEKLTRPDFEVDPALDEKLALYETADGAQLRIIYLPTDITPNVVGARVEGGGISDRIVIQRFGSRWYLMIGQLRDQPSGPSPSPASTR